MSIPSLPHPAAQTPHPDPDPATDLLELLRILELGEGLAEPKKRHIRL